MTSRYSIPRLPASTKKEFIIEQSTLFPYKFCTDYNPEFLSNHITQTEYDRVLNQINNCDAILNWASYNKKYKEPNCRLCGVCILSMFTCAIPFDVVETTNSDKSDRAKKSIDSILQKENASDEGVTWSYKPGHGLRCPDCCIMIHLPDLRPRDPQPTETIIKDPEDNLKIKAIKF